MMIKRILTVFAAIVAGAAGTSLASAAGIPTPAEPDLFRAALRYPVTTTVQERRGADAVPDFDPVDDQSAQRHNSRCRAAPTARRPVMSPDDPRYGRSSSTPVYSNRDLPPGPVMSPEDPRYGQPGPSQYQTPTRAPETVASTGGATDGLTPPAPVGPPLRCGR